MSTKQLGRLSSMIDTHARAGAKLNGKLFVKLATIGDGNAGSIWMHLRNVESFSFERGVSDGTKRYEDIQGVKVPREASYDQRDPMINFKLSEHHNPYNLQLGWGDNTAGVNATRSIDTNYFALAGLQYDKWYDLPFEYGNQSQVAAASENVAAAAYAGPGSVPGSTTHYYLVVGKYGTGDNAMICPYDAGSEDSVTLTTEDTVSLTWDLVAGVPEPDQWLICRDAAGGSAAAYANNLVDTIDGGLRSYVDVSATATGTVTVGDGAYTVTVTNEAESVTYTGGGTDYTLNLATGRIKIHSTGSIGEGRVIILNLATTLDGKVTLTYDYGRNTSELIPTLFIGEMRHPTEGSSTNYSIGVAYELDAVDWRKGASVLDPISEDAGLEFSLPVMCDESNDRFGQLRVHDPTLGASDVEDMVA